SQFLSSLAASRHCSPQSASHCNAEKRRKDIRTIIHVLIKRSCVVLSYLPTNQADRIHVKKQRRCASLGCRFGIKEMSFPKRHFKGMHFRGILVQQVSQVGGGLVCRCDRQKHGRIIRMCSSSQCTKHG